MITWQDCKNLYDKFRQYADTAAEQHEFARLFQIDTMMQLSLEKWKEEVHQEEAAAIFRVIEKLFGIKGEIADEQN